MFRFMHTKLPEFIKKMYVAVHDVDDTKTMEIHGLESLHSAKMQSLRTGRIEEAVHEIAGRDDVQHVEVLVLPRVPETMHTVLIKGKDENGKTTKIIMEVINIIHPTEETEFDGCTDIEDRSPNLGLHSGGAYIMKYKILPGGDIDKKIIPVSVVFLDVKEIEKSGLSQDDAIRKVASTIEGPAAINIFDMDAVTTTSDGIVVEGAIVRMGASDNGKVNNEFGILPMQEITLSDELVDKEPHLKQWKKLFPEKKMFRGPNPKDKKIPVHNVVITGRASNNNSATEMMNIITMDEVLFPILGQLECMHHGDVLVGLTGQVISVGIGMTVAEMYGRVFPHPQFEAGDTAHGSGAYAKTLKQYIPCIVCDKKVIARLTIRALQCGCVPARDIGCSPVVLSIARAMGTPIDFDRITPAAQAELDSIGCTREWMKQTSHMTADEVIAHADEILPGVEQAKKYHADDLLVEKEI